MKYQVHNSVGTFQCEDSVKQGMKLLITKNLVDPVAFAYYAQNVI